MRFLPFLLLLIVSCEQASVRNETNQFIQKKDSLEDNISSNPDSNSHERMSVCDCAPLKESALDESLSLHFDKYAFRKLRDTTNGIIVEETPWHDSLLLAEYSDPKKAGKIRSLTISGYSEGLSDDFKRFSGVEHLAVESGMIMYPERVFPNLKTIESFGSKIIFSGERCQLEEIRMSKSELKGIRSFSQLPLLKRFSVGACFVDSLPSDIHLATCIQEFIFAQNPGVRINAASMDVSQLSCLNQLVLICYDKSIRGIPKGIENTTLQDIHLWVGLEKPEKDTLRVMKKSKKSLVFPDWK